MFGPNIPGILRRIKDLHSYKIEAVEELAKKWNVHPLYIGAVYDFVQLKELANSGDNKVNVPTEDLVDELIAISYICGDLLSKRKVDGAPYSFIEDNKVFDYEPRCTSVHIMENWKQIKDGDLIVCIDRIFQDNKFRVVDKGGESIGNYCKDKPGYELCSLVKNEIKVKELTLDQVLNRLEEKFVRKNKNFFQIKEDVAKVMRPILQEINNLEEEARNFF